MRHDAAPAAIVTFRDWILPPIGRIVALWRKPRLEFTAMLYIYSAKTLRAMLADAKQAVKLVDDNEAYAVQEMIDAITHELSTRKD